MSLKLVPISPFVSVTETGTSAALKLQSALIQKIVADGSGSVLTVIGKNGSNGIEKYSVTQTPAQVAALTQIHIELTEYSTSTWGSMYVNAMCFRDQVIDEGSYRTVFLDFGGGARSFRVTQSLATLLTGLNTSIPAEPTPVVTGVIATVAGAGTGTITTTAPEAIIPIGNTANGFIVILPAAVAGTILHLVATSAFTTVIDGNGAETVDGGASITLGTTGAALTLMCHTTGSWVSQATQVGTARALKTDTIQPIDPATVITIGGTDSGVSVQDLGTGTVKLQATSGDAVVESSSGLVSIRTTTGTLNIQGAGANPVTMKTTGAGDVVLDAQGTGGIDIKVTGAGAIDVTGDGTNRIALNNSTAGIELQGSYTYIGSLVGFDSGVAVTGAAVPGTVATTACVNVTTNGLGNGIQFPTSNGATHYVVRNTGANPVFFWDETSAPIRATALAVGDVAVFWKFGATWVSQDFTPVA